MGILKTNIEFGYPAPKTEKVLKTISDITGLPVSIVETIMEDKLYDCNVYFAFNGFPEQKVKMYSYRPGAVKEFYKEIMEEDEGNPVMTNVLQGCNEPEGKQSLYLEVYLGQELTLFVGAIRALELLGGVNQRDLSIPEDKFNFPISVSDLKKRYQKQKKLINKNWIQILFLLPFLIPYYILKVLLQLIKMPFKLWRALKEAKKKYPEKFNNKNT
jgi:hypothetical protein